MSEATAADQLSDQVFTLRAQVAALREALEILLDEAEGFNVSGVYFSEPCMGHKGPALARAALEMTGGVK